MSAIRRMAFRLTPLPDEPLDSWLEAMAAAYRVPLRDVLHAVGLRGQHAPPEDRKLAGIKPRWLFELNDDQITRISAATGLSEQIIRATTRTHYAASVTTRTKAGIVTALSAVGGISGRFCPECLADSGGRWRLTWGYVFGFACPRHRHILTDRCPSCGVEPRVQARSGLRVPTPMLCDRCATDLTHAAPPIAAPDTVLEAQRTLLRLITTGEGGFGMYRGVPQPALRAVEDIRLLRRAAFTHLMSGAPINTLGLSEDLVRTVRDQQWSNTELARMRSHTAASSAVGFAIAVHAARSRDAARALLKDAIPDYTVYSRYSPIMQDILADALRRHRRPASRLQLATLANDDRLLARKVKLPTLMWTEWAEALIGPRGAQVERRAALSALTMLVGSHLTHDQARTMFDPARERERGWLSSVLAAAPRDPTESLIALARALDENPVPIDYDRRRAASWGVMIHTWRWKALAEEHNVHHGGARRYRAIELIMYMWLSGNHPHSAPGGSPSATEIAETLRLEKSLPPALRDALLQVAGEHLQRRGIEEPVTWSPPPQWAGLATVDDDAGHALPARRPARSELGDGQGITADYRDHKSLRVIAAESGVSRQSVTRELHYLGVPLRAAHAPIRHDLDIRWLRHQYVRRQRSLRDLADETGTSPTTIKNRLVEAGVEMRRRGGSRPRWLR